MTDPKRYLTIYFAPLAARARRRAAPGASPPLESRHWAMPATQPPPPSLSLGQLFAAGVEEGRAEARGELKRRIAAIDNASLEAGGAAGLAPRLLEAVDREQAMRRLIERSESMLEVFRKLIGRDATVERV